MSHPRTTADLPATPLAEARDHLLEQIARLEQGGGAKGVERQHRHGRLTARERLDRLF
ncbi:MAG: hypothetical protein RJA16_37, partial [Planctomycetota bacterium]